ncbi:hypothetical protein [Rubripirellula reticaptiva]|uniref:Neutral/alkaline non-lysosomal ceramidase n=1 Tax=Rubripirellula reticaptiva TaxID=2528013 RepID=A0A5C6EP27_9BACT|nr:hypothetical protein [Rubripirellula reticaptiva]TWU49767.1 Neutral/alkaline non-lysosomal ceramidase [Rubripirellula reticaptiva]
MNRIETFAPCTWARIHSGSKIVVLHRQPIGILFSGIVLAVMFVGSVSAVEPATFRAGASAVKITPPLGLPIIGNWDSPPATKIHDDLHVRCLALDDGETTLVFAICDNVGIPREVFDQARRLIQSETDLPPTHVMMSATHTHSAVSARGTRQVDGIEVLDSYQTLVANRISQAVAHAIGNLKPAKIGWGSVDEPSEVHNRRWFVSNPKLLGNPFGGVDRVRMNPPSGNSALIKPAGPIDPEVSFIIAKSLDGKPIALLANYSLHYVGGVPGGEVSADYFGAFADRIGGKIGADDSFVGIMTNGTSGDVNNVPFREKRRSQPSYERIEEVSELIANRVADSVRSIDYQDSVQLAAAAQDLVLAMRKPDAEMQRYFTSLQNENISPESIHRHARVYAQRAGQLADGPDQTAVMLQAFRIGDLAITAIPFEVFAETGLDLKKRNPFSDSFTIELANGSEGYLPTPAQHELGGYETWMGTNRVQLDASQRISEVLLALLQRLAPASDHSEVE